MSAKVVEEGFTVVGYESPQEVSRKSVRIVHAEVPGPNGEWLFVIQAEKFSWVKGLPEGDGYHIYDYPLHGPPESRSDQIDRYRNEVPKETDSYTHVAAGEKTSLLERMFLLAE